MLAFIGRHSSTTMFGFPLSPLFPPLYLTHLSLSLSLWGGSLIDPFYTHAPHTHTHGHTAHTVLF
jgi:hypothetical protein